MPQVPQNGQRPDVPAPVFAALLGMMGFASVSFEVALTRLFSLILFPDSVFLAISFAVLGLGLGAALFSRARARDLDAFPFPLVVLYGLSFPLTLLLALSLPLSGSHLSWIVSGAAVLPPFVLMGFFAGWFYAALPQRSGLLYAFDLCGAAAGALFSVAGMDFLGPVLYTLLLAVLVALAATLASYRVNGRTSRIAAVLALLTVILAAAGVRTVRTGTLEPLLFRRNVPGKALFDEVRKGEVQTEAVRWNSMARLDLISRPGYPCRFIYTDGAVPATMFQYTDNRETVDRYLRHFIGYAPFAFGASDRVLGIGSGAGLDVLLGRAAGSRDITAVEVNGAMVKLVREQSDYNGGVLSLPGVTAITGEGRCFVRASQKKYDCILFLLAQGNNAEAGGRVFTESALMTREAFGEYYDRLAPGGRIAVVTHNQNRASRILMTWADMLRERGMGLPDAMRRTAFLSYPDPGYRYLLIFCRDLPAPADMQALKAFSDSTRCRAEYIPYVMEDDYYFGGMARGTVTANDFMASSPGGVDIAPVTDDRPFQNDTGPGVPGGLKGLVLASALALLLLMAVPLFSGARSGHRRRFLGWEFYFACLGAGFMMAEVVLTRKLMLSLGEPSRALTVVLFALLLGAGLGGALSQRYLIGRPQKRPWARIALVALLLVLFALFSAGLMDRLSGAGQGARSALAFALLFVPALFMGVPFPFGLSRAQEQLPGSGAWFWGVSGVAAVAGSLFAMVFAIRYGLTAALLAAAGLYLLAALSGRILFRSGSGVQT